MEEWEKNCVLYRKTQLNIKKIPVFVFRDRDLITII